MLHEQLPEFLGEEQVRGGCLARDGEEDRVGGGVNRGVVRGGGGEGEGGEEGGDVVQDGQSVGGLALSKERNGYGDDGPTTSFVAVEDVGADGEDGGGGAGEPGVVDAYEFLPGWLAWSLLQPRRCRWGRK